MTKLVTSQAIGRSVTGTLVLAALALAALGAPAAQPHQSTNTAATTTTKASPTLPPATVRKPGCQLRGPYDYPQGSRPVDLRPRDFTTRIDNPYWPMRPGTVWKFVDSSDDETQQITIKVTQRTKVIEGIRARVVHDVVRSGGALVEDTLDWYAQDSGGNIWYLGEDTKEYENGKVVSTEGSWRHGRRGAQAGILIPARPQAGCSYREEYLKGEAEDQSLILSLLESMKTQTGFHRQVLHTSNSTPLTPDILENKFYARGIGPVLEIDVSPTFARSELVGVSRP